MPSGLFALLDDIATIAKVAAASIDDIGAAASKAGVKAAGVVVDDTAVTPRYVTGFTPDRELPIIWRITKGSIFNKLMQILPALLLLSAVAECAITPGSYTHLYVDKRELLQRVGKRSERHGDPHGASLL